jgi:hypothetical protein
MILVGDGTDAVNLVPGDYVITSVLDGYTDTPVSVTLTRDGFSIACGLAQQGGGAS